MNIKKRTRMIALLLLFTTILLTGFEPHSSLARSQLRPPTQESGPDWVLLSASDVQLEDNFGYAAAIDGDFLVASSPGKALKGEGDGASARGVSGGPLAGAVYVYRRQGEAWTEGVKLVAADAQAGDQFGLRVALSADTLAVGAPYKQVSPGGNAAGAVYVFQRQGDAWSQQACLTAPDGAPLDLFGSTLALQGDILAVGARSADLPDRRNAGAVYVYQRQGAAWSLQAKLVSKDAGELDYFGQDLVLFEDELLVGAPGRDERSSGDNFGAVYLFQRKGDTWRQAARLSAPDLAPNAQFGYALSLDERSGTLVVYAQQARPNPDPEPGMENYVFRENYLGTVYVFERRAEDWRYQARLTPSQRPDVGIYFLPVGRVVAGGSSLSGEFIVLSMGFYGNCFFQREGDRWTEFPAPDLTSQGLGVRSRGQPLAADEELLIFQTNHPVDTSAAILLVEMRVPK